MVKTLLKSPFIYLFTEISHHLCVFWNSLVFDSCTACCLRNFAHMSKKASKIKAFRRSVGVRLFCILTKTYNLACDLFVLLFVNFFMQCSKNIIISMLLLYFCLLNCLLKKFFLLEMQISFLELKLK